MEIYIVEDKATGKKIGNGFKVKSEAKTERNRLQEATKQGIPPNDQKQNQTLWNYKVSKGKDHPHNQVH